jgi:hypothetical protein
MISIFSILLEEENFKGGEKKDGRGEGEFRGEKKRKGSLRGGEEEKEEGEEKDGGGEKGEKEEEEEEDGGGEKRGRSPFTMVRRYRSTWWPQDL